MAIPPRSLAWTRLGLFCAAPLVYGLVALASGMDANWDLRNYHYYNAWAFLTDRYDRDIAAAQIPSFYNPLLDLPYFLLAQWLSARMLAFLLGAVASLNFICLTALGERLLPLPDGPRRLWMAAFLAAAGCSGALALSEVGTVFYDNILSLGFFASLLLAVGGWRRLTDTLLRRALPWAFLVGLPVGLAFGLKQTSVLFAIGICAAMLLCLPVTPWRRFLLATFCGLGVLTGLMAGGGYWMAHLWRAYGNPMFPMFNDLFLSPWGRPDAYRDTQNLHLSLAQRILFPLFFSFDTHLVSEIDFRDFRLLAAFVILPLAGLLRLLERRRHLAESSTFGPEGSAAFAMIGAVVAYAVWVPLFAFYRYITALEMLAPLLVGVALIRARSLGRCRSALTVVLVGALVVTTKPGDWIRVPFSAKAVDVEVPAIPQPERTIVLLAGHEPLSFLLPAFPPELSFLRIDSTFTNPDQKEVRFNQVMLQRIKTHEGPMLALFIPSEGKDVTRRLADYGLRLGSRCDEVTSPIGAAPYALCPVSPSER